MTPTVSVMMAAYNTKRYVEAAVVSILGQTFADFELLILDDGSTDGTRAVLEGLAAKDDRIRLVSRPNAGILATRNELLGMARGEFAAVLDSDDVAMPRRLEIEVDYLRRHPDCLAVGGDVEVIDPDGTALCTWRMRRSHEEIDSALMLGDGMVICHSASMIRRAAMLDVGGYWARPGDRGGGEDMDLWLRLAERGRLTNLPRVLVRYRVHSTSASYAGVVRQAGSGRAAIEDARARRGLDPAPIPVQETRLASPAEEHQRWAWWALGGGHVAAARKHAVASLTRNPFSSSSWKLLLCAIRGR